MSCQLLVVDDQSDITGWMRPALENEGWGVTVCNDGASAITLHSAHKFDLIILDVGMPFLNGFEVATVMRAADAVTPILFYSAHLTDKDKARVATYAPSELLIKSDLENLIKAVRYILRPMMEAEKIAPTSTPPTIDRRKRERPHAPLWAVVLICLVAANFTATTVQVVRGLYTFGMVAQTYGYVREATHSERAGQVLEARIPATKGALPAPLRDGSQDVTFRVAPEDASKARQLAQKRGVRLRVEVR